LKIVELSKIQVIKEQINEAIWMFFNRRSSVAIHAIVGGAHQALHDLTDREASMIKNDSAALNSGKGSEWYTRLNKEYNFLKHAKSDKGETIKFDPLLHTFYLVDCLYMYRKLTGEKLHNQTVFDAWFALSNPNTIGSERIRELSKFIAAHDMNPENYEYFASILQ